MKKYKIQGGLTLSGEIDIPGNKNAALPCIAAALLTDKEVVLENVPSIQDVKTLLEILKFMGAEVETNGTNCKIKAKNINTHTIPRNLGEKIRASILLISPILLRCGKINMYPPGGDVIGKRRLDTHFNALHELGAKIKIEKDIEISSEKLTGANVWLEESSVTGTANIISAAVLAKGKTVITNAACEPHIEDLCKMLCLMGAKISGVGSNRLTIDGVSSLSGCRFTISPDYITAGSYMGLAVATKGDIKLNGINAESIKNIQNVFERLGVKWECKDSSIRVNCLNKGITIRENPFDELAKIESMPWPGFPSDLLSIIITIATQIDGDFIFYEKLFESRLGFTNVLNTMGAKILLCDPHRVVVHGPTKLYGAERSGYILNAPDIRAGMAILIAALCADGDSIMNDPYHINRGYEDIIKNINNLGGNISLIKEYGIEI